MSSLHDFASFLNTRYSFVDSSQLSSLIEEFQSSLQVAEKTTSASGLCTYIFKSGKNKGSACGAKECEPSSERCKKHIEKTTTSEVPDKEKKIEKTKQSSLTSFVNSNGKEEKDDEKKTHSAPKKSKAEKEEKRSPPKPGKLGKKGLDLESMSKKDVMKVIESRMTSMVLTRIGENYVHHGTNIVFDPETKMAIGRLMSNQKVIPLSNNDIQLCVANNWTYLSANGKKVESSTVPTLEQVDPNEEDEDLYEDLYDEEDGDNE